jgi:uncharacterized RDD family membrane protein YckC
MMSRLVARLIDGLFTVVAGLVVVTLLATILVLSNANGSGPMIVVVVLTVLLIVLAPAVYEVVLLGTTGTTLGKRVMGIEVLDDETLRPIGIGRALGRYLVLGLSGSILVGYVSPYFDESRRLRGWHDRAVHDVVVRRSAKTDLPGHPVRGANPLRWIPAIVAGFVVLIVGALCLRESLSTLQDKNPHDIAGERIQVLAAAKPCVAAIVSYDYRKLPASERAGRACITGAFKADYTKAMETTVKTLAPQTKTVQVFQVAKAGIERVSSDGKQWVVLLYGQQQVTNSTTAKNKPRLDILNVEATLNKVGNKWLISSIH